MSHRTQLVIFLLSTLLFCKADKDNPLEYLKDTFQISRPFTVDKVKNDNISFHCKPAKENYFEECLFKTPEGRQFQAQRDGNVLDSETNQVVTGIKSFFESEGISQILLQSIKKPPKRKQFLIILICFSFEK